MRELELDFAKVEVGATPEGWSVTHGGAGGMTVAYSFELRMVDAGGAAFGGSRNPVLRLTIPPGHIGGTFVETPGRIGPWQAHNGDLYFIMEPAETARSY